MKAGCICSEKNTLDYRVVFSQQMNSAFIIAIQLGIWSFKSGDTKLEIFLPKNQHNQRKLLNFENWCSGRCQIVPKKFNFQSQLSMSKNFTNSINQRSNVEKQSPIKMKSKAQNSIISFGYVDF